MYSLSDKNIEKQLGQRFRLLRLRKNYTQKELAIATQVSLNSIKALEMGKAKLATVIAVLRVLNELDQLNSFIPEPSISPIQLAKLKGKQRQRASGSRTQSPLAGSIDNSTESSAKDETEW